MTTGRLAGQRVREHRGRWPRVVCRGTPAGVLVGVLLLLAAQVAVAQIPEWRLGDVFLAVGDGAYHVYDRGGQFVQALQDRRGGYTSDCCFNATLDRLYTVNYTHTKVVVFADGGPQGIVQTIDAAEVSPDGHSGSIVFGADGSFYVGHPGGNALVHRYNAAGMLTATYAVPVEGRRGTNWIDLSADQRTLFYTSAGRTIQRFDLQSYAAQQPFAVLPGDGHAEGVRLLPPGDGSGGVLVADGLNVKRLDAAGEVVQVYDLADRDSWFAINVEPDGKSFWATDSESDHVCRFNLETGLLEQAFAAGPGNSVFGVCVKGEFKAAVAQDGTGTAPASGLGTNYPNPFNPRTAITYHLSRPGPVRLEVYNLLGQQVTSLVQGERDSGHHTVEWDGRDASGMEVASGVYISRFTAGELLQTRRMLLLK